MAVQIPNGTAYHSLRLEQTGDPDPMFTTLGTFWASGSESLTVHATAVADSFATEIVPFMDAVFRFKGIRSLGRTTGGTLEEAEVAYDVVGTGTGGTLPPNCAALVKKTSASPGRANRGRFYVPGLLSDDDVDSLGNIVNPTLSTLAAAFNDWFSALDLRTPTAQPAILHTGPGAATAVTSFALQTMIATQRRRLR